MHRSSLARLPTLAVSVTALWDIVLAHELDRLASAVVACKAPAWRTSTSSPV
jgi:hypothetical protein